MFPKSFAVHHSSIHGMNLLSCLKLGHYPRYLFPAQYRQASISYPMLETCYRSAYQTLWQPEIALNNHHKMFLEVEIFSL